MQKRSRATSCNILPRSWFDTSSAASVAPYKSDVEQWIALELTLLLQKGARTADQCADEARDGPHDPVTHLRKPADAVHRSTLPEQSLDIADRFVKTLVVVVAMLVLHSAETGSHAR